jgi:hypothetical protein
MGLLDRQFARNANELEKPGQVLEENTKTFGDEITGLAVADELPGTSI